MIIDFHSHILPEMDDGSQSTQETVKMLSMMTQQGINCVIATPHFYPNKMRIADFLKKRDEAYQKVLSDREANWPLVKCGAELAFFRGIGKSDNLESLCIDSTDLLMIEMPFRSWTKQDFKEIESVIDRGITPILAHVERYYAYQQDSSEFYPIIQLPLYLQVNAAAFTSFRMRKIAKRIMDCGEPILLGSDCHDSIRRQPNLLEGRKALQKKYGEQFLIRMDELGERLLVIDGIPRREINE